MIVIVPPFIRGVESNQEIFWSRIEKEFKDSVTIDTAKLNISLQQKLIELKPDLVISVSDVGKISDYKTISFVENPFLHMNKSCNSFLLKMRLKIRKRQSYATKTQLQIESLKDSIKVTNSNFMAEMYHKVGKFKVIPMGVDHELFRPMDKKELRKKYGLPMNKTIKIFVGSTHKVKGWKHIKKMIQEDTSCYWILVLKDVDISSGHNFVTFCKVSQNILAELYNCADLLVAKSVVESFGLAVVEAMMCDLPVDVTKTGVFWDWEPDMNNPRDEAMKKGLDKYTWMKNWREFVSETI